MRIQEKFEKCLRVTDLNSNILFQDWMMFSKCALERMKRKKKKKISSSANSWDILKHSHFSLNWATFFFFKSPFCTFPVRLWTSCLLSKNITIQLIFWKQWQILITPWLSSLFRVWSDRKWHKWVASQFTRSVQREQRPRTEVCDSWETAAGDSAFELWIFK